MQETTFALVPQSAGLEELIAKTKALALASKTFSTRRSHESAWKELQSWAGQHGLTFLGGAPTPEVIALYLADKASSLTPQTLTKRLTSITQAMRAAGFEGPSPASSRHPLVGSVLRGIRRTKGVAPGPNQKKPLLTEQIRQLVATCGNDLPGIRDRALMLVGFAGGGIRRAELVVVDAAALEFCDAGVIYHQGRSKTDQEGVGRKIGIPWGADPDTCPVSALLKWLDKACIQVSHVFQAGPVFPAISARGVVAKHALNPASVSYIVKHRARLAGMKDEDYGSHSLRSGFCSQAALTVGDRLIAKQSGHKCMKSLDPYVRLSRIFKENAASTLGL